MLHEQLVFYKSQENMKLKCSLFLLGSFIISTAFSGVARNSALTPDGKVRGCGKFNFSFLKIIHNWYVLSSISSRNAPIKRWLDDKSYKRRIHLTLSSALPNWNNTQWWSFLRRPKFVVTAKHCLFDELKNPFTNKRVRVVPVPHEQFVLLAGGYLRNDVKAQVRCLLH